MRILQTNFWETVCFDPVTLTALGTILGGLGGAGAAAATIFGPKPKAPQMPTPAPPVQSPVGNQDTNATGQSGPSFLAAAAAPQSNNTAAQKSLLGQ